MNVLIGNKEYHIRDLWMEIFRNGMNACKSWKDKTDVELQVLFDYWIKEKYEYEAHR